MFSAVALFTLVTMANFNGNTLQVVSFSIYGSTLILMYLSSTLYHGFASPRIKRIFQLADHAAIYLLIAGTYTPFTLVSLRGSWGWTLFGLIWGFAIAGITLTFLFPGRFRPLFTVLYVGMGWLAVIVFKPLMDVLLVEGLLWLVGGGVLYSLGVIFYLWKSLQYGHVIWHFFVLAGSTCHFFAILLFVLPASPV